MRPIMPLLLLSLVACSQAGETSPDAPATQPPSASATASTGLGASAASSVESNGARAVAQSSELLEFEYSYPAEAGAIPGLRQLLDARLEKTRSELVAQAREAQRAADDGDFPYRMHTTMVEWKTVADLPRFLSLSGEIYTYSSGAHGYTGSTSLVWDKRADRPLKPIDLFRSASALDHALGGRFCAALNQEREERRGEPVDPQAEDAFSACPPISELTVLLGSSNGETFDRVGLIADPYVAGPYAEGPYEVTLGVDFALIDAVKPEYRQAFTRRR